MKALQEKIKVLETDMKMLKIDCEEKVK